MLVHLNAVSLFAVYCFVCLLIYILILWLKKRTFVHPHILSKRRKNAEKRRKRGSLSDCRQELTLNILFIIAHPDDECMFFGPSLRHFASNKDTNVRILCLSTGNFYGEGDRRRKELEDSCAIFGLLSKHVFTVNQEGLEDDPLIFWDVNLVASTILKIVKKQHIDQIITFDRHGVSGHRNHISVYRGVRHLVAEHLLPKGSKAYSLETVSFFRKYLSFFDLPFSLIMAAIPGSRILLSSPVDVLRTQRAMKAHWSQFVWFRILYVMFSRYMLVNTLQPITRNSPT